MDKPELSKDEHECHEIHGALYTISMLKDELELRLHEARDNCAREVLDNSMALIDAKDREYRHRKNSLCFQVKGNT